MKNTPVFLIASFPHPSLVAALIFTSLFGWVGYAVTAGESPAASAPSAEKPASQPAVADETFDQCRALAEKGEPAAQYRLAERLYAGKGVEKDVTQAVDWYKKAANAGNVAAQVKMGTIYGGLDPNADRYKALEQHIYWVRKAAEQGSIGGINHMIEAYEKGEGGVVPKDPKLVSFWMDKRMEAYKKQAAEGNVGALFQIGDYYRNGEGVPADPKAAREWYEKAAQSDWPDAMATLGEMYAAGEGVTRDDKAAITGYEKAAAKKNPRGGWLLAEACANGTGVAKDMARANELYTQAFAILSTGKRMSSRSATGEAYYMLARLYEAGLGTPKDPAKAKEWFQQAANFGSGQAKDELNKMTTRETMPLKP